MGNKEQFQRTVIDGVNEKDLIKRVQSGDEDAMNILISNYYQSVFAYFYKNTNKYHQSKDLTQEVFIKMVSGIFRYKPKASFKSWLFTIASNHLKNYYRLLFRHPELLALSEDVLISKPMIFEAEIRSDMRQALKSLPPEQKETVKYQRQPCANRYTRRNYVCLQEGGFLLYAKAEHLEYGLLESNRFLPYHKVSFLLDFVRIFARKLCGCFFAGGKI